MLKRALLIAFHFPPCSGSSGLQRTLGFTRFLPRHGWQPLVLSARPMAYEQTSANQLRDVPEDVTVARAFALDTARHLSLWRRHPQFLALPDRWSSWLPAAIVRGLRLISHHRPQVIWSTYPIATAHLIGANLARLSGLPWVADFRDPMVEQDARTGELYPRASRVRESRLAVEQLCARRARAAVFCTPGAAGIFTARYADFPRERVQIIANGFDEEIFSEVEHQRAASPAPGTPRLLLHSGVLYPGTDRDPAPFFDALRRLLDEGRISADTLRVVLRASGHDELIAGQIGARRLDAIVRLEPSIPYREALTEMLAADGLLIFQGYTSNPAIPAKLYEYLRCRRPIFAMADHGGDTAALLRANSAGCVVDPERAQEIAPALADFLERLERQAVPVIAPAALERFARHNLAAELAELFDRIALAPAQEAR